MGLDTFELVLEVEEAFDIKIPDERATEMATVGDVYDFLIESTQGATRDQSVCLAAATFFMIRRALGSELEINPRKLRPRTRLNAVLPKRSRRRHWHHIERELEIRLPPLARPAWLVAASSVFVAAISGWVAVSATQAWGASFAVMPTVGTLIGCVLAATWLTVPLANDLRPRFATLRGLSTTVLAYNYAKLSRRFGTWTREDVWHALHAIIVDQLGVRPEAVTRDAHFVRDLGAA